MSRDDSEEGFLARWSRRKRASDPDEGASEPGTANEGAAERPVETGCSEPDQQPERSTLREEDIDFGSLDAQSDYTRFMDGDVPDDVRNRALARLWTSDPDFANLDGLTDYSEDFTDAALVPVTALKTAYKVGQGFLSDEEVADWDALGKPEAADVDEAGASDLCPVAGPTAPGVAAAAISIGIETPLQDDVRRLFEASDAFMAELYPADSNHPVTPEALVAGGAVFVLARGAEGDAIGCGAILCAPGGDAEIKRMWVDPHVRGTGTGRRILDALLEAARTRDVRVVRLETGTCQPAAIGLYKSAGFTERAAFGNYTDDLNSVFMELQLPVEAKPTA